MSTDDPPAARPVTLPSWSNQGQTLTLVLTATDAAAASDALIEVTEMVRIGNVKPTAQTAWTLLQAELSTGSAGVEDARTRQLEHPLPTTGGLLCLTLLAAGPVAMRKGLQRLTERLHFGHRSLSGEGGPAWTTLYGEYREQPGQRPAQNA